MSIRTRMSGRVTTARNGAEQRIKAVAGAIDRTAIIAGIAATVLVGLNALLIPIIPVFGFVTGGVAGGFIAAYVAGGLVRGTVHAIVAGLVGGFNLALVAAGQGFLIGLFLETPTLIGQFTPAISAVLAETPLLATIGVLLGLPLLVAFDAAIGGVIGSVLRTLRDRIA